MTKKAIDFLYDFVFPLCENNFVQSIQGPLMC